MNQSSHIAVDDTSAVGGARRFAQGFAASLGFAATEVGRVGIVATELANNMIKHAGRGEIVLRALPARPQPGIELLALDRGPGMRNVAECRRDGYSTAGSPGTGLGAVSRLSQTCDIYSGPDLGTAVLARLWSQPAVTAAEIDIGLVCLPKPGEDYCGDSCAVVNGTAPLRILLADGLGHGPMAAAAATEAVKTFYEEKPPCDPHHMITLIHAALRRTRGAAVATASIDFTRGIARYAGVGNISASIVSPAAAESRRLVSQNGTAGVEIRKVQEFSYPWPPDASLVMHSDGLGTQWHLQRYPGLLTRDPALIAGVLYRDYRRETDDVTVLVLRKAGHH